MTLSLLTYSREYVLIKISQELRCLRFTTHTDDILQESVRVFLQNGGNLFTGGHRQNYVLQDLLGCGGTNTANLISRSLFHLSESWTVDELSSFGICLLGAIAHVDPEFRTRLKECLGSYRSPLLAAGTIYTDSLYESTFGIASVLGHFHRLDSYNSRMLLCTLCRSSTASTLRPFLEIGIDLDHPVNSMLGCAASIGNLEIVRMLIARGANGALALPNLIKCGKDLSDGVFNHLLELLVECSRPASFTQMNGDALYSVISTSRALLSHPKVPEILICRKVLSDVLINHPCRESNYECNYMCLAIREKLRSIVELFLQHGLYANTKSAWLMHSIKCGATSCTEVLIQHGADVNFQDGEGQSALQLARSNVASSHPRIRSPCTRDMCYECRVRVTAEEDAATLAVVEQALRLKGQSTDSIKEYHPECGSEVQSHEKITPVPRNVFGKALEFLSTYYRRPPLRRYSRDRYYEMGDLWSMSFYEALLVRFFYVLSYLLVLAVGVFAVIRGDKRVQMPSRTVLSAVALLLLAYIWGSSLQINLLLKPDTGRSVTEQDS